ncbi:MAG TPA: hypothetical protein PKI03_18170 [Pseudomonadota bacterium]|nr:hypothetical protein [Pseudomonadota bacterium]
MDDKAFLAAFLQRRLPAFHHRDHVRLAWIYLRQDASLIGLDAFVRALQAFAADAGQPGIYHETMTWAYLLLLRERMARCPGTDFATFAGENPDLLTWKPSVLDRYYRAETLASDLARKVFLLPDRGLDSDGHTP